MTDNTIFSYVFDAVAAEAKAAKELQEKRQEGDRLIGEMIEKARDEALRHLMADLHISLEDATPIVNGKVLLDTWGFQVNAPRWLWGKDTHHQVYPLSQPDELEPIPFTSLDLSVRITHLESQKVICPAHLKVRWAFCRDIQVTAGIAEKVGAALKSLQKDYEDLPGRIQEAEEEWQAQQAQIKADQEAEAKREAEWEAQSAARRIEAEQQRAARQAREDTLRAEVAEKFGVSSAAFDYLIEALATTLERRASYLFADEDEE